MNMTRKELFRSFYSKRIYFFHKREQFKEDVVELKTVRSLLSVSCRDWEKTPMSYLSAKEALAVGIMIYVKKNYRGIKYINRAIELCEYAYMETKNREISYMASLALGVLYFELALLEGDFKKKEKLFKASSAYIKTSSEIAPGDDHSSLYQAVVQQGRGQDLHEVAKSLVKASKVTDSPAPIYKMLTNIYTQLDMGKASEFYKKKWEEWEELDELLLCA